MVVGTGDQEVGGTLPRTNRPRNRVCAALARGIALYVAVRPSPVWYGMLTRSRQALCRFFEASACTLLHARRRAARRARQGPSFMLDGARPATTGVQVAVWARVAFASAVRKPGEPEARPRDRTDSGGK